MDLNVLLFINSIYQGHAVYSLTKNVCDFTVMLLYMRATKFLDLFFLLNFIQFLRAIKPIFCELLYHEL